MQNSVRKPEPEQINKILSKIVSSKALKKGIINVRVEELWKKVMGENVEKYTDGLKCYGNDDSAKKTQSWRYENDRKWSNTHTKRESIGVTTWKVNHVKALKMI